MHMSDHEILYDYNHAADQAAQVRILAELNAVDIPTMRNKLLDLGAQGVPPERAKMPRRRGNASYDKKCAMELYNAGCCDEVIAKELGISQRSVYDWRRNRGLKANRKRPGPKRN